MLLFYNVLLILIKEKGGKLPVELDAVLCGQKSQHLMFTSPFIVPIGDTYYVHWVSTTEPGHGEVSGLYHVGLCKYTLGSMYLITQIGN